MTDIVTAARPPTPPRSSSRLEGCSDVEVPKTLQQTFLSTPDESPASCTISVDSGSGRIRKRVDFSPWAPPVFTPSSSTKQSIRPLPPSRECKSSTSILKSSSQPLPQSGPQPAPVHAYDSLAEMLTSIMQQLATGDRSAVLDAYATLAGTMKGFDDIPETGALKEQLHNLCKYIRRDIQTDGVELGPADSNIITSALKVAIAIVWDVSFNYLLTDEFRSFLLDRCIIALESEHTPKSVVLHYIHLLSVQNFRPNIMSKSRAHKFLHALQTITDRISGKNVVSERYAAYRRFVGQAPSVMKTNDFWLEHLLDGMTSTVNDTRNRAVEFGVAATGAFDNSGSISTNLSNLLDIPRKDGHAYIDIVTKRMIKLIEAEGEGKVVPKIWAIVIRLLRGNNIEIFERSRHLRALLSVIQRCFNSTTHDVRASAYTAWNQFIAVNMKLNERTPAQLRKVLLSPISQQLGRLEAGKPSKSKKTSATSSYCCLLYYSFRPQASHDQYTKLFKEYILDVWSESFLATSTNTDRACRILISLFWNEKSRFWAETRVSEAATFEPDDIPVIDNKWVRRNSKDILQLFRLLFRKAFWGPDNSDGSYIALAWKAFSRALGEAGRKEIIPSSETVDTVASILTLFRQIWSEGLVSLNVSGQEKSLSFIWRCQFLLQTMMSQMGHIPFVEPMLLDSAGGDFLGKSDIQASGTTSSLSTPIQHLLRTFIAEVPAEARDAPSGVVIGKVVRDLIRILTEGKGSRATRIRFYKSCLDTLTAATEKSNSTYVRYEACNGVLDNLQKEMSFSPKMTHFSRQHDLVEVADDVVRILELAIHLPNSQPWSAILQAVVEHTKVAKGNAIALQTILEPVAIYMASHTVHSNPLCATEIVQIYADNKGFWPVRGAFGKIKSKEANQETLSAGPITRLLNTYLIIAYEAESANLVLMPRQVISAGTRFIKQCPLDQVITQFQRLEGSLTKWMKDPDRQLEGVHDLATAKRGSARSLWMSTIARLCDLTEDSDALFALEPIFDAAFSSTQRDVANMMVDMWNNTYGTLEALNYPPLLEATLRKLRMHVNLELPGIEESQGPDVSSSPLSFADSNEDDDAVAMPLRNPRTSITPLRMASKSPSAISMKISIGHNTKSVVSTPARSNKKAKKQEVSRKKHEDSQLYFTAIDSSPMRIATLESQLLTDRQKEVRDRQRNDLATTFIDLRSSPTASKSRRSESSPPTLPPMLAEKAATVPSTPELPTHETMDIDEGIMSSPTPRSSLKGPELGALDAPSSPISLNENMDGEFQQTSSIEGRNPNQVLVEANVLLQEKLAEKSNIAAEALNLSHGKRELTLNYLVDTSAETRVGDLLGEALNETPLNNSSKGEADDTEGHMTEADGNLNFEPGEQKGDNTIDLYPAALGPVLVPVPVPVPVLLQDISLCDTEQEDDGTAKEVVDQDTGTTVLPAAPNKLLESTLRAHELNQPSSPPTSDADELESALQSQISQDIISHETWDTAPESELPPQETNVSSSQIAGDSEMSKRPPGRPRKAMSPVTLASTPAVEMGDTIIVDTARLASRSKPEGEADQRTMEDSSPLKVSSQPTPRRRKRASPTLSTSRKRKSTHGRSPTPTPNAEDHADEETPTKRARTTRPENSEQDIVVEDSIIITPEIADDYRADMKVNEGQSSTVFLDTAMHHLPDEANTQQSHKEPINPEQHTAYQPKTTSNPNPPISHQVSSSSSIPSSSSSSSQPQNCPATAPTTKEEQQPSTATTSESAVLSTLQSLVHSLKNREVQISKAGLRRMADLLFDIRSSAQDAVRRGGGDDE